MIFDKSKAPLSNALPPTLALTLSLLDKNLNLYGTPHWVINIIAMIFDKSKAPLSNAPTTLPSNPFTLAEKFKGDAVVSHQRRGKILWEKPNEVSAQM